mmetsp:Transcript_32213/g.53238  ORF Transcript_32213/g.53238 Transcript_32213/m.53238 type:complete len:210 (+) Transcript_32213:60-689(+)
MKGNSSSSSSTLTMLEQGLQPFDFPTGRLGVPADHPQMALLKELVAKYAAEHQLADKMGPRKYYDRQLRSRLEVVTSIVNLVKPDEGRGGKFKRRYEKNGPWIVDSGYNVMDLRSRVSSALCKHPNAKKAAIKDAALLKEQLALLGDFTDITRHRRAPDTAQANHVSLIRSNVAVDATNDNSLAILSWVAGEVSSTSSGGLITLLKSND